MYFPLLVVLIERRPIFLI